MGILKKKTHSIDFKTTIDSEVRYLNRCSMHDYFFSKDDKNGKLKKYYSEPLVIKTELVECERLKIAGIIPDFVSTSKCITYETRHLISLRSYLDTNKKSKHISLVIYELFSFVKTFKKDCFIHGNLTIDNVFINPVSSPIKFYTVDMLSYCTIIPDDYTDTKSIRNSLREYYKDNKKMLVIIG